MPRGHSVPLQALSFSAVNLIEGSSYDAVVEGFDDAGAFAEVFAAVDIFNGTGADVEIDFAYLFSIEAFAQRDGRKSSDALSDASFALDVIGTLISGPSSDFALVEADAISGPESDFFLNDDVFTLLLVPDETASIDLDVIASGVSVPVPSVPALTALGLGIIGIRRRLV